MKKPAAAPRSHLSAPVQDEPREIVQEMIAQLSVLRDRERDARLHGAYRAAVERLEELIYRLTTKPEKRVIGLPLKQTAPPPAPEPPQRTLPLGPVPLIVKARKPKRR